MATADLKLAETRAFGTTDERTVLALETIADQLRMIVQFIIPTIAPEGTEKSATDFGQTLTANQAWENEGGCTNTKPPMPHLK